MNKAERQIGELCYANAKNKRGAEQYLNRYARMHRDKDMDRAKDARKQNKLDMLEQEGELRFDK